MRERAVTEHVFRINGADQSDGGDINEITKIDHDADSFIVSIFARVYFYWEILVRF